MNKSLICLLIAVCSPWALPARADCDTEATATPTSTCVVLARAGIRGVWFSLTEAETLRQEHLEVPELHIQVDRLTQLADVQTSRVAAYREAADLRLQANTVLESQWASALTREARARAELGAWYREPSLWFTVGIAVAALVLAVAFGLK